MKFWLHVLARRRLLLLFHGEVRVQQLLAPKQIGFACQRLLRFFEKCQRSTRKWLIRVAEVGNSIQKEFRSRNSLSLLVLAQSRLLELALLGLRGQRRPEQLASVFPKLQLSN